MNHYDKQGQSLVSQNQFYAFSKYIVYSYSNINHLRFYEQINVDV